MLGAGASVEAGIPDAYEMTKKIIQKVNEPKFPIGPFDKEAPEIKRVINFLLGGLLFKLGQTNHNPLQEGVNVEDLFNSVLLLAERDRLEVAPFVESWHSMIDSLDSLNSPRPDLEKIIDAITEAAAGEAEKRIMTFLRQNYFRRAGSNSRRIADQLKRALEANHQKPGRGHIFSRTATRMLMMLGEIVWVNDPTKVEYLIPIVDRTKKNQRLLVTTLNYDNTVELIASSQQLPCNTGIESWSQTGTFDFKGNGLHLIKLHGSIDWTSQRHAGSRERPMPRTVVSKIDDYIPKQDIDRMGNDARPPAVIFGQRNKLTSDGPFLDLLRQFQNELRDSNSLIVIGYSFRDSHVNTYISQWLNESPDHILSVIDPGFNTSSEEYIKELRRMLRLENRLKIIEKKTSEGLQELFA